MITTTAPGNRILFEERTGPGWRAWIWLPVIVVVTALAIAPIAVPIAVLAWVINVVRYRGTVVRVDEDYAWVNRRWVRLAALDLSTLGRASNTWPWRSFSSRYLGANPIWTRDSVGLRGLDGGRRVWLSVGTDRRDELVRVLESAIPAARERAPAGPAGLLPPPGWYADPWRLASRRWWDGRQWTGYAWPPAPGGPAS